MTINPSESERIMMLRAIDEAEDKEEAEEVEAVYRRPRPPREPAQVYSVRVPVDRLSQLRDLAEREGVPASALVRRFVIEGIERVTRGESGLADRVVALEERLNAMTKEHSAIVNEVEAQLTGALTTIRTSPGE